MPLTFFLNITHNIQLVGNVDQFGRVDLAVALGQPGLEPAVIQLGLMAQSPADGVDDECRK